MQHKIFVYAIKDPDTNEVRYVGQTRQGNKRFTSHKNSYKYKRNLPINNFVKKLANQNKIPIFEVIENCTLDNLDNREIYWIKYYRDLGAKLLNLTSGGDGALGLRKTPKQKELHKLLLTNENKKKMFDGLDNWKKQNPDQLYKLTSSNLGRKWTKEQKKRMSDAAKRRYENPEERLKTSKAHKGKTMPKCFEHKRIIREGFYTRLYCFETNKMYYSINDASRQLFISNVSIKNILSNKIKSCKGYSFRYLTEEELKSYNQLLKDTYNSSNNTDYNRNTNN